MLICIDMYRRTHPNRPLHNGRLARPRGEVCTVGALLSGRVGRRRAVLAGPTARLARTSTHIAQPPLPAPPGLVYTA